MGRKVRGDAHTLAPGSKGDSRRYAPGTLANILFSVSMGQDNCLDSPHSLLSCSFLLVRGVRKGDSKTKSLQDASINRLSLTCRKVYSAKPVIS